MIKLFKLLIITGFLVLCTRAEAQVAGWITNSDPSGSTESASLYNQINFGVGSLDVRIKAGSANPSSVATLGRIGDLYISTNGSTYQKQDAGVTTNWTVFTAVAPTGGLDAPWGGTIPIVVGSPAQVASEDATHAFISTAISSATSGGRITILTGTFEENVTVTKPISFVGSGSATIVSGTITFEDASDLSSMERLKIQDDVIYESGAQGIMITDNIWTSIYVELSEASATSITGNEFESIGD